MALNTKLILINQNETNSNEKCEFDLETTDFSIVAKKKYFIDKSLFIKEIIKDQDSNIAITVPRGFGKSTNLDMLKKFLEIPVNLNGRILDREQSANYKIFKKLIIYEDDEFFEEHFARYPVVHVDLKNINGNSYDEVLNSCRVLLHKTFKQYSYLLESSKLDSKDLEHFNRFYDEEKYKFLDETDVTERGLCYLTTYLHKHFNNKTVFLLIDNFYSFKLAFTKKIRYFLKRLLFFSTNNNYIKNEYQLKTVLTDIIYFHTNFEQLNFCDYFNQFNFHCGHKFVPYFGLTEFEVSTLLVKYEIDKEMIKQVKSYYGSYVSEDGIKTFRLLSILNFLKTKEIRNYWDNSTALLDFNEILLKVPIFRYLIEKLSSEVALPIRYFHTNLDSYLNDILLKVCNYSVKQEDYLCLMFHEGYLTYARCFVRKLRGDEVKIANNEICAMFKNYLRLYYERSYYNNLSILSSLEECAEIFNKVIPNAENYIYQHFIRKFNMLLMKLNDQPNSEIIKTNYIFDILNKTDFLIISKHILLHAIVNYLILLKGNFAILMLTEKNCINYLLIAHVKGHMKYLPYENEIQRIIFIELIVNKNNTANMKVGNFRDITDFRSF